MGRQAFLGRDIVPRGCPLEDEVPVPEETVSSTSGVLLSPSSRRFALLVPSRCVVHPHLRASAGSSGNRATGRTLRLPAGEAVRLL